VAKGDFLISAVYAEPAVEPQMMVVKIAGGYGDTFHMRLVGITVDPKLSPRIVDSIPWRTIADFRYQGDIGGWDRGRPTELGMPYLSRHGLSEHTPDGIINLLPVVRPAYDERAEVNASILCSGRDYLIFARTLAAQEVQNERELPFTVYDRKSRVITELKAPGTESRLRLFGEWLTILVIEPNPSHMLNPGRESMREVGTSDLPPTREQYDNPATGPMLFPGWIRCVNLRTGETIDLRTHQADSEVLDISGQKVLYRVNKTLFEAEIVNGRLKAVERIVEDDRVPDIHWVFRSPG
jgi:hypothetical protein